MNKRIFLSLSILISACGDNSDRMLAHKQIEAENENLNSRAKSMEADLERQTRLVTALAGTYEGEYTKDAIKPTRIRMTISASLPPYITEKRIRTPEEIAADLQRIFIKVDTASWDADLKIALGGCSYDDVRPDIEKGLFHLVSAECDSFTLKIITEDTPKSLDRILAGVVDKVFILRGTRRTHFSLTPFNVELRRVD